MSSPIEVPDEALPRVRAGTRAAIEASVMDGALRAAQDDPISYDL